MLDKAKEYIRKQLDELYRLNNQHSVIYEINDLEEVLREIEAVNATDTYYMSKIENLEKQRDELEEDAYNRELDMDELEDELYELEEQNSILRMMIKELGGDMDA